MFFLHLHRCFKQLWEGSLSYTNASAFAMLCLIRDWQNKFSMKCITKKKYFTYNGLSDNSSHLALTTEHFGDPGLWWEIPSCSAAQGSSFLVFNHKTTPRKKTPSLNPEQSIRFTTVDILMFKYRQEQRHKMTQRAHSFPAEGYSTHPEGSSKNQHVVWQCVTPVNKIWWKGNLYPTNPCLKIPYYMFRALWTLALSHKESWRSLSLP